MLRVKAGGRDLRIRWEHNERPEQPPEWPYRPYTVCMIEEEGAAHPKWITVGLGISYLHPNDRYDKEIGRQVSLGKALSNLFPYMELPYNYPNFPSEVGRNYEARRDVWSAYFARKKPKTGTWTIAKVDHATGIVSVNVEES